MTHLTPNNPFPGNPVAVVLKFLGAAWTDNRVEWTAVPAAPADPADSPEFLPPQVKLLGASEAEIRAFVAAVEQLAGLFAPPEADPIDPVTITLAASDPLPGSRFPTGRVLVVASPGEPPHEVAAEEAGDWKGHP